MYSTVETVEASVFAKGCWISELGIGIRTGTFKILYFIYNTHLRYWEVREKPNSISRLTFENSTYHACYIVRNPEEWM